MHHDPQPPSSSAPSRARRRRRRRGSGWTLPSPLSSFVGRRRELDALAESLAAGARLVTIAGPGGIGKTRLAIEAARRLARDGVPVALCDLSEVESREELVSAVAAALGAPSAGAKGTSHVGASLAREGRCVVVLDNFEQLAEHAPLVGGWLAEAPEAAFVVTSRERLRIDGEHVHELSPLGLVAAPGGGPGDCDAVRLLLERGRAASSIFAAAAADLTIAAEIVRALDGIPLAIELCAARLGVLGLAQLRDGLAESGILAVAAGGRGGTPRHATLRAAIDWSWRLLDARERDTLARCSVFCGGFRLDAAASVLDLPAGPRGTAEALERVQALYDRSLLRAALGASPAERRFALYASVREYAAARLEESGAAAGTRAAHARHYVAKGRALADAADGPAGRRAREELAEESANLSAVARAAPSPEAALAALLALEPILAERGPLDPYAAALDRAVSLAPPGEARARAVLARARLDITRGRFDDGIALFARARDEARAIGDRRVAALATSKLAVLAAFLDRTDVDASFDEAEAIARDLGDARLIGICHSDRASALSRDGLEDEALAQHERALACFTRAGDAHRRAVALGYVGASCVAVGRFADGERRASEAIDELRAQGDARAEGHVLGFLARARHGRGALHDAAAALRAAAERLVAVGDRWFEGVYEGWLGDVALEDARPADAVLSYERAVRTLDAAGERPYAALFRAALAVARAASRDPGAAPLVDPAGLPSTIAAAVRAHEAHAALLRHDARVDAARAALAATARAERASDDVRFARRLLARAIDRLAGDDHDALAVGPDARWFERRGRPRVQLERHRALRLLLLRLVDARLATPGVAVPRAELIAAGWPGERIRLDAAHNRLNVSLTRMKRLGLRDVLRTQDDGVLLDPSVACTCKDL